MIPSVKLNELKKQAKGKEESLVFVAMPEGF